MKLSPLFAALLCLATGSCSQPDSRNQPASTMQTSDAELEARTKSAYGISVEALALFLTDDRFVQTSEVSLRSGFRGNRYRELEEAGYVTITSRDKKGPPVPGSGERVTIQSTAKGEALWALFRHELPPDHPAFN